MSKSNEQLEKDINKELLESIERELIEEIPFESRDVENLIYSYMNECGYSREEAIKAAGILGYN